ncbi:MAG: hypothetical protein J3R72DRAFT_459343 [Linnemannia gamsii]|nr:MAG: hypothetical protein J3R72DRAFT_459343 [Linnemannia gamsii]
MTMRLAALGLFYALCLDQCKGVGGNSGLQFLKTGISALLSFLLFFCFCFLRFLLLTFVLLTYFMTFLLIYLCLWFFLLPLYFIFPSTF